MRCSRCQHANPAGQKFCGECGLRLASGRPPFGAANPLGQKFGDGCGTSLDQALAAQRGASPDAYTPRHLAERILTSRSALEGERKQVTVLFADIEGSLELIEGGDPEQAKLLLDLVVGAMMDAVHGSEGTVNKILGDGIMALFGAPLAHEDHAVRACYAALAMQDAARRLADQARARFGVEPRIRVGLHSGEVVVRAIGNDLSLDYDAVGPTAHLAARMERLARPGTIRLTQSTLRLAEGFVRVEPLGRVPVKGLDRPVDSYELQGATPTRSRFQVAVARGLVQFVGRDADLEALDRALAGAADGHGQVFALVGDPGVGKSRLVYEFIRLHRTAGMLVLESGSLPNGSAAAYRPVIDLLKAYCRIDDRDDARRIHEKVIGKLLSLDEGLAPVSPALLDLLDAPADDPAWAALEPSQRRRRILEAIETVLARESEAQPLVLVFEDLHWSDSETQAFLDSLVETLPTARILLLVTYRPEHRHGWASRSCYTQRRLEPLPPPKAKELLHDLLGDDASLGGLKALLLKHGNPFLLEETVLALVESGSLEGRRGRYRLVGPLQALQIPPTVQAILSARIDRLPPEQKQLLQAAAVVGKDVPYAVLQAIAGLPTDALHRGLADLEEHEFLYEARLLPDREHTFKHALTQEVAYGSLLAERRRALHGHIVAAFVRLYPDRLAEHVERLAHHAVQGELWEQAVDFQRQAGAKAAARSAYREAVAGFEQALAALGHLPQARDTLRQAIDLRFELRSSLQALNEHKRVVEHLREAEKLAAALEDRARLGWASAYLSQYLWRMGEPQRAEELGRRALAIAAELDDVALQAVAGFFPGQGYFIFGDYRRAIDHCRRNVAVLKGELAYGRLGLTGLPSVLSRIWLAWSLAERGEFAEAIKHAGDALSVAAAAGQPYSMAAAHLGVGEVHLLQGALEQAVPMLERANGLCADSHLLVIDATAASALGLAYALCGRLAEAMPLLEEAEARAPAARIFDTATARTALCTGYLLAGRIDEAAKIARRVAAFAAEHGYRGIQARAWRVLAEIAARRDPPALARAEEQYRRTLALAEEMDMHPLVAHCRLGLGRLYRRVGKRRKADEQVAVALAMYRDMGMRSWAEKAESHLLPG